MCLRVEKHYIDAEGKFIWVEGEAVCNFGKKHKGRRLSDILTEDPGYLEWIIRSVFSMEVNEMATKAFNGEFPKPPEPLQQATDEF